MHGGRFDGERLHALGDHGADLDVTAQGRQHGPVEVPDTKFVRQFGRNFHKGLRLQLSRVRRDSPDDAAAVQLGQPVGAENVREPWVFGLVKLVAFAGPKLGDRIVTCWP